VAVGGVRAHGLQAGEDAIERAGQLRPILHELAGLSARKVAAVLNERKVATPTGGVWMRPRLFECGSGSGSPKGSQTKRPGARPRTRVA
jgi:hypothetical protein